MGISLCEFYNLLLVLVVSRAWLEAYYPMATDLAFMQAVVPRFDGHYDYLSILIEIFLWLKEY